MRYPICNTSIARYPIKTSAKECGDTISASTARYEKYRCWASKLLGILRAKNSSGSCPFNFLDDINAFVQIVVFCYDWKRLFSKRSMFSTRRGARECRVAIFFSLAEAPLPDTPTPPNTPKPTRNGPEADPKQTRNGPETDPNGPETDPKWTEIKLSGPGVGRPRGLSGWGGRKGKR